MRHIGAYLPSDRHHDKEVKTDMTPQEHAKYLAAYRRGQKDAKQDNKYEIVMEQSNVEKQGYSDGFMTTMDELDPR